MTKKEKMIDKIAIMLIKCVKEQPIKFPTLSTMSDNSIKYHMTYVADKMFDAVFSRSDAVSVQHIEDWFVDHVLPNYDKAVFSNEVLPNIDKFKHLN